jgi:hypothetical protein
LSTHSYLFQFANPLVAPVDDLEQVCALALDLQQLSATALDSPAPPQR